MADTRPAKRQRTSDGDHATTFSLSIDTRSNDSALESLLRQLEENVHANVLLQLGRKLIKRRLHLLAIPAEIRNRIAEGVLVEDSAITITGAGQPLPALLQACRQLREEYAKMYYTANRFTFVIQSFNCYPLLPWFAVQKRHVGGEMLQTKMKLVGAPDWTNVKAWCRLVHGDAALIWWPNDLYSTAPFFADVTPLFQATFDMRGVDWAIVEKVLESMRAYLVKKDVLWSI